MTPSVTKVPLPLALPATVVDEISSWGVRLDRSGSWLLTTAWNLSRSWISRLSVESADVRARDEHGPSISRRWFVPAETLIEIGYAADRLRVEPEKIAMLAWSFARPGP